MRALEHRVVGQTAALERIVDSYEMLQAGLHSHQRPVANFLFLGPTGSGKTHVVEALAETLFPQTRALVKVDCAEFQHSHEIAKLIGSPPGYLGHRETHPVLTQEALDQCHTPELALSLVLFDEIEKASDALWQLLLGILDKATLTLGDNRRVNFSRAMIFLTSNIGAGEMEHLLRPGFGFVPDVCILPPAERLELVAVAAARRKFSPEFFNRLDHVVVFHPLSSAQLENVLDLELDAVRARLAAAHRRAPAFACSRRARARLLSLGFDARYGARHLKRAIERELVHPLARLVATRQVTAEDSILVDAEPGHEALLFSRDAPRALIARGA